MAGNTFIPVVLLVILDIYIIVSALDVCKDTATDCKSCVNLDYPVPSPNRTNCMKTCQVCKFVNTVALKDTQTHQSSTVYGGRSSRAVDGITDGDFFNSYSCTHTDNALNNWWCVNLQTIYNIKNIKMYNRVGRDSKRLQGFEVNTGPVGTCNAAGFTSSTPCYINAPQSDQTVYNVDTCNHGNQASISAGTIFVHLNKTEVLTLCEVEIYTDVTCSDGYYSTSSTTCEPCDKCSNKNCKPDTGVCRGDCYTGWYGTKCDVGCPTGCDGGCSKDSGECIGGCKPGMYGTKCQQACSGCDGACTKDTGDCIGGCKPGMYGTKCLQTCSDGCNNTVCTMMDGNCSQGCTVGQYGPRCQMKCNDGCKDTDCTQIDGSCTKGCITGWYCKNCEATCPPGCKEGCNQTSGTCDECKDGTVGLFCNITCGVDCPSITEEEKKWSTCQDEDCQRTCDQNDMCSYGCIGGRRNVTCSIEKAVDDTLTGEGNTTTVIATVISVIVVLVVVAVMVMFLVFRRRRQRKANNADVGRAEIVSPVFVPEDVANSTNKKPSDRRRPEKENKSDVVEAFIVSAPVVNVDKVSKKNKPEIATKPMKATGSTYENVAGAEGPSVYENHDIVNRSPTRVDLDYLIKYIKHHKDNLSFAEEFEDLPKGLCSAYDYGMNAVNKPKNRYKKMCAFNHSRVKLDIENDDPNSDYINACYITGYGSCENKYIASQGPVIDMINEFWRMIWDVETGRIVMMTNLLELGVQKCLQYWPEKNREKQYGNISIKLVDEKILTHFIIRCLEVTKNGCKPRIIEQYHYTSWPDKSIPTDMTSLIEFRHKVNKSTTSLPGPMVIHCSAGIGRTGTYIALDYLIEEGKVMDSVDVVKCVEQMRYERVNMVQNLEQYIFLHEALAVAFIVRDAMSVTSYQEDYRKLLKLNSTTRRPETKNKILELFKVLDELSPAPASTDLTVALSEDNKTKNRDLSVVPANDRRIYLPYGGAGTNDYINAVTLPSFRNKQGYILTQTPLKQTVVDFWRMLIETKVKVVVGIEADQTADNIGEYLPVSGQLQTGVFTVTKEAEEQHELYTVTICSVYSTTDADVNRKITFYHCNFWMSGEITPSSTGLIVSLLKDIEVSSTETNHPIAVHCLNGVEKSGVFCVLAAVLDRLKTEHDVNILLTVLQLRLSRHKIITSPEQLKFCFDTVGDFVENVSTYANC